MNRGIRRTIGVVQIGKSPLMAADLRDMCERLPNTLIGIRDRAILLLGFALASRRSELVSLDAEDITFSEEGLTVLLRRSKTDQEGLGRTIGVPRLPTSECCPVRATHAWLDASGITSGPIFRPVAVGGRLQTTRLSGDAVAQIVKRRLGSGKDAARYAGHSLRSGLVSSAAAGGASIKAICNQTGHKSVAIVLRYIREQSLFKGNALGMTGL